MEIPQVGIGIGNNETSNTDYLTGVSAFKVVRELGYNFVREKYTYIIITALV